MTRKDKKIFDIKLEGLVLVNIHIWYVNIRRESQVLSCGFIIIKAFWVASTIRNKSLY